MITFKSKDGKHEVCIMNLRRGGPQDSNVDFKVDRGTPLGNIFYMKSKAYKDEVCDHYIDWFNVRAKQPEKYDQIYAEIDRLFSALVNHKKIRLYCWCAPKRCHAETIAEYLIKQIEEE